MSPSRHHQIGWSYQQIAAASFLKTFLRTFSTLRIKWPLSLKPHHESDRFVVMNPASTDLYTGVSTDSEIKPEPIGGTWYPEPYTSSTSLSGNQHVILHFHGGSYILGDGRTSSCGFMAKTFLQHTSAAFVLCPQYRLATHTKSRFPAQLQDAITSYMYLIHTLRIPASRIVLSGDSSGAHLALNLLRYIAEFNNTELLPVPKCGWLWSPWCDVPAARDIRAWTQSENYRTEYIPGSFPALGARCFLGDLEIKGDVEKYMAPLWHPFSVPCPVLVGTGNREVLFHDHEKMAEVLKEEVKGMEPGVEIVVADKVPHDVFMIGWIMDFKEEARDCAVKAGEFLDRIGTGDGGEVDAS